MRRGVAGVEKPVFGNQGGDQGTGQVGVIREYSDRMLEMLLKAHRPEKYREHYDITRTAESDIDREIRDLTETLNRRAREMGA